MSYKRPERILLRIVKKKKRSFGCRSYPHGIWHGTGIDQLVDSYGLSPSNILRDPRRDTRKILARHRKDSGEISVWCTSGIPITRSSANLMGALHGVNFHYSS